MAKTLVEKVTSPNPDVSVFKISGTLGYHENEIILKFFRECTKKRISRLVIDFSSLGSLGGGCARIIRDRAMKGGIVIGVAGASKMVQKFLSKGETQIYFEKSVEAAAKAIATLEIPGGTPEQVEVVQEAVKLDPLGELDDDTLVGTDSAAPTAPQAGEAARATAKPAAPTAVEEAPPEESQLISTAVYNKMRRQLLEYRSLFTLNADFNRMHEKSRLLDAFLLTTIAQIGVESAAFLELSDGVLVAAAWKGFETAEPESLGFKAADVKVDEWLQSPSIHEVDKAPLNAGAKKVLRTWDMVYAAPFIVYGSFRGILLLGKPIRNELGEESWEYLSMLTQQVSIAYEHSCRFEKEGDRMLGLVHSLISVIEHNTMTKGSNEAIVNYVHALAVEMHYPEESIHDLLYGTVLRDIGMLKVSDLIVRSPRELLKEEWEIIKRHPLDGAAMLENMKFSPHTVDIVKCHHERFNGEGYPNRLQGGQIPFGARIVSVVESFTAMMLDKPTRPALTQEEALNTIRENWGLRYDPDVVTQFVEIVEEEIRTGKKIHYKGSEQLRIQWKG